MTSLILNSLEFLPLLTEGIKVKARIIVFDPIVSEEVVASYGAKKVTMLELFSSTHFITLHMPLTKVTYFMFCMLYFILHANYFYVKDTKNIVSNETLKMAAAV